MFWQVTAMIFPKNDSKKIRVAWLCPYPVDTLPEEKVRWNKSRKFHPATWVVNLSNALAISDDIDLHIVTETSWICRDYRFIHNRINFHILRNPYSVPFFKRGFPSYFRIDMFTRYFLNIKNLSEEIKRINPDLIHVHGTESQYAYCASKINNRLVLISMQGLCGRLKNIDPRLRKREIFEIEAIRRARYFISRAIVSDEYILKINPRGQLFKVDDICSNEFFNILRSPQPGRLLYVGSVLRSKGIEDLFAAFALVKRSYRDAQLRIAGHCEKRYKEWLLQKFLEPEHDKDVVFLGQISREFILREYSSADVFVFPSQFETSPNVIMEAMSAGLPIIATKTGGIPDMIRNGVNGILVDLHAPDQIAESIKNLFVNSAFKFRLADAARESAKTRFTEDIVVLKTIKAYNNIISIYARGENWH